MKIGEFMLEEGRWVNVDSVFRGVGEEGFAELFARGGFDDELPGEAAIATLVEGGGRRRDEEMGILGEFGVGLLDLGEGGALGLISDTEAGEVSIGRHLLGATLLKEIIGEIVEIGLDSGLDDGVVGLVSLDENLGFVEVTATDTTDDLSKELESALLRGEIWQGETGIGLDDTDGGEVREIEPAGESLGADEDVDIAGFDGIVEGGEVVGLGIVAVETGDFGVGEELGELGFEELGAETFVNNIDVLAAGAGRGDFLSVAADVAVQGIGVGVEGHR